MKVTTILGSPKKNGNTAKVLGFLEELIKNDHDLNRVNAAFKDVSGCMGCYACQKVPDEPGCVQDDDAASVFEQIIDADVVVYAAPLYCWGFPAQMKPLIDRSLCLSTGYGTPEHKSLVKGKRVALLVTCDGPIDNNADLIQSVFDRFTSFLQCDVIGKYIVPFCLKPNAVDETGAEIAKKMAADMLQHS
jgi:multimeric flavodoxin WrbA